VERVLVRSNAVALHKRLKLPLEHLAAYSDVERRVFADGTEGGFGKVAEGLRPHLSTIFGLDGERARLTFC
jgi:hypothetical protein